MKNFGIIGNPLDHSLSPILHDSICEQINYNYDYKKFEFSNSDIIEPNDGECLLKVKVVSVCGTDIRREFNKKWNYHKKMDANEIENDIRFDTIWRRPTSSFGSGRKFYNFTINGEDMGTFDNPAGFQPQSNKLLKSLSILKLDINTDLKLIKKRYKELVKEHHPDVKGDSKKVIDKFREIVEAYNYLIERYKK